MSLTLYHGAPNGPSLTVLAALHETGHEAELVAVDLAAGERHAKAPQARLVEMSIEGEGPVLMVDGEPMADSVFIAQYLDESGNGALQPTDAYARWEMEMWCRFVVERVAPAAAFIGTRACLAPKLQAMDEAEFEALVGRIASDDLAARWRRARDGDYPEAQLEDSRTKIRQAVEKLEKRLTGDWILGPFTIADLETYAWLAGMVALVPEAFADAPKAMSWLERVKARPSVQKALGRAGGGDPLQAWAPGPEINRWG